MFSDQWTVGAWLSELGPLPQMEPPSMLAQLATEVVRTSVAAVRLMSTRLASVAAPEEWLLSSH